MSSAAHVAAARVFAAALLIGLIWVPVRASALTIEFDGLAHGEVITTQLAGFGVQVNVANLGAGPDLGVVFDTGAIGTSDPDLENPTQQNFVGDIGNVLIIQENSTGCEDGICDDPDDEGARPAGSIQILFDTALSSFGFDLIDIDSTDVEHGHIDFLLDGSPVATVSLTEIECASGTFCDPTVNFADGVANRLAPFNSGDLGGIFDEVVVNLGGSGAIDRLDYAPVPEPSSSLLLGAALAGLAALRRRLC